MSKKTSKITHVARYFLTVHFDSVFTPQSNSGLEQVIIDVLTDISQLARRSGIRLSAEYSIVRGKTGIHAHILVNWLPTTRVRDKRLKTRITRIRRHQIIQIFDQNFLRTDNQTKRIKKIQSNSDVVRRYAMVQSNGEQEVLIRGFWQANFIPVYTEIKIHSYYSLPYFQIIRKQQKLGCLQKLFMISILSLDILFMIIWLIMVLLY